MTNSLSASQWAWEFLRRNPKYRSDYSRLNTRGRQAIDQLFPLLQQTATDQEAAKWGLLAFEDPDIQARQALPFWAIGPTLEAEIVRTGDKPFLPMLRRAGTRANGLQLLGGAMVLTLERDNQSLQILLRDGRSFDETSNVILRLPVNLSLPAHIARGLNFCSLVADKQVKKIMARLAL
ncbi:MAG: hypothetical protein ISR45_03265, partial [Rhodospirillales bacterium]|nr:hypothetical protein [Rhodospirillales bacterium]